MKVNPSWAIAAAAVLMVASLVGIVALVAGGASAWWVLGRLAIEPPVAEITPLAATPVRPVLVPSALPTVEKTMRPVTSTPTPNISLTGPPTLTPDLTDTDGDLARPQMSDASCIPLNQLSVTAVVQRVIDGFTIEVDENGMVYSVSYIGLALPEDSTGPAFQTRAREANEALVSGKTVLLVRNVLEQDVSGIHPRYVLVGSTFVNYEMIRLGYAAAVETAPNRSCSAFFLEAEQRAASAQLGFWSAEPTVTRNLIPSPTASVAVTGPLLITGVSERGTIWEEPEEFVEFRNDSQEPLQLEGWTLHDSERHVFTFPSFVLGPGEYCRVYTNLYRPWSCGFTYASPSPIWDNLTECAYLKDPYGELISTFCYGFQ